MTDQQFQRSLEVSRQEQSFLKLITTLNTSSILLIVAFLEKLFKNPEYKYFIIISLICFVVSILSSLIIYIKIILSVDKDSELDIEPGCMSFILFIFLLGGFFIGIVSLVIFAIINLY